MTKSPDDDSKRAAETWRTMVEFLMRSAPQRLQSQQAHGLTPNDSRALVSLDKEGRPIGVLAREWCCDPSTATCLVHRLERVHLAERILSPNGRRVKLVHATEKGLETRTALMPAYHQPPSEMTDLSPRELDELISIFRKLYGH